MMQIEYDKQADAAYISLEEVGKNVVARTEELKEDVFIDFDKHGRILGIEILSAKKRLPKDTLN